MREPWLPIDLLGSLEPPVITGGGKAQLAALTASLAAAARNYRNSRRHSTGAPPTRCSPELTRLESFQPPSSDSELPPNSSELPRD